MHYFFFQLSEWWSCAYLQFHARIWKAVNISEPPSSVCFHAREQQCPGREREPGWGQGSGWQERSERCSRLFTDTEVEWMGERELAARRWGRRLRSAAPRRFQTLFNAAMLRPAVWAAARCLNRATTLTSTDITTGV